MKKNEEPQRSVFFVEKNERYWWFFDLYGSTMRIRAYCGVADRPTSCKRLYVRTPSGCKVPKILVTIITFFITAVSDLHTQPREVRSDSSLDCISFRNESAPTHTSPQTVLLVLNYCATGSRGSFEPISIHIPTYGGSMITASTPSLTSASSEDYLSANSSYANEQKLEVFFETCTYY